MITENKVQLYWFKDAKKKDMEHVKDLKICLEPNKFELINCIYEKNEENQQN